MAYLNFMQWITGKQTADAASGAAATAGSSPNAPAPAPAPVDSASAARHTRLLSFVPHFVCLFSEPLSVVNKKAQRAVPVPDGLDLDKEIHPGADRETTEDEDEFTGAVGGGKSSKDDGYSLKLDDDEFGAGKPPKKLTPQEIEDSKKRVCTLDSTLHD